MPGRELTSALPVCLNSLDTFELKQMLIMMDKQIYISYVFLFREYLGWSLAFNMLFKVAGPRGASKKRSDDRGRGLHFDNTAEGPFRR